ncbi:n-alkane-inducible cytochrome P450 [Penicillium lagena]|uniref:n-alkane-inducible cytochrome P450 n=1 Tax=Penicillium lagena TaxID=94218 RepID=UPI0025425C02|nr:n-alkane-inducible cytochrome P450 [Penicillium lagena]KAJ5613234.1 n-alkane-inducible cytochrome P450 [Penicillium lagena]
MVLVSLDISATPYVVLAAGAVAIVFTILKIAQFVHEWKYARDNGCQPPIHTVVRGPLGLGLVTDMLAAARENRILELVHGWHREFGTTFKAKMVARTIVFTVEPKNVQTVLALKFKDFELGELRNRAFRPLLGSGIFSTDGSKWEHSRGLLRPNFTRNQITDINVYETHVAALIKRIPCDGSTFDLQDLFFRMVIASLTLLFSRIWLTHGKTLDSATEFLFGESVHSLNDGTSTSASSFATDFNTAQEGLAFRTRLGPLMLFHRDRKFSKAVVDARAYVDRFVQKAINYRVSLDSGEKVPEDARKLNEQQYVFLYELSKRTRDKAELTDQLLSILLAGRDTTASLLSITFFTMARRPEIWKKLREEVLTLGGRKPSFEDLKSMTYLSWVLNETLRFYPIVPMNARMANKDTYLPVGGGPDGKSPLYIAKGHEVMYSVHTMHRLPEHFGPDADEYRPERWETLRPGWAYLPFNGGPRICIGQQFALTEAGYTTVRLMQHFETIENRDPKPFEEGLTLTMASFNGTKVAMTLSKGS